MRFLIASVFLIGLAHCASIPDHNTHHHDTHHQPTHHDHHNVGHHDHHDGHHDHHDGHKHDEHKYDGHHVHHKRSVDEAIAVRVVRSPHDAYGHPMVVAGRDSEYSGSHTAVGSMAAKGTSALAAGTSSKISSSKSSSSESNKGTKIKSSTNFGAGQQSVNSNMFGAVGTSNLNLGIGGIHGGGYSENKGVAVHQQGLNAQTGFVTGSSNTEIEQSESSKQSASETHDESHDTHIAGGSQFQVAGQTATRDNVHAREGEYVAVGGHGGHGVGGNRGVYGSNKDYGSSSDSVSAINAKGTSAINAGQSSRVSSSKASSSESNKGTKIKTGTTFGAGTANIQASNLAATQTSGLNYGGFGVGGLSAGHTAGVVGHNLDANSAYVQGSSNTEIEQTESNKQSASESHDESHSSGIAAVNQFELAGQTAEHNSQYGKENAYAYQH